MTNFLKYPSIENHYREKTIAHFINLYGDDLYKTKYVLEEKLHGANIQLIFEGGGSSEIDLTIASRNQIIPEDDSFYGVRDVVANIDFGWLYQFLRVVGNFRSVTRLYGELIGPGIQKGVDYGSKKQIRLFNMMVNDNMVCQSDFTYLLRKYGGAEELLVPSLGVVNSLPEALEFDHRFDSKILNKPDNICEGIVIKPYVRVFTDPCGQVFFLKKKNDEFKEKQTKKRVVCTEFPEDIESWRSTFLDYLTEERVQSIFSKHGMITSTKQVGEYIGHVMRDAHETFMKEEEFEESDYGKQELKYIFGNSKDVPKMLMKHI